MEPFNYEKLKDENPIAAGMFFKQRRHLTKRAWFLYPDDALGDDASAKKYETLCQQLGKQERPILMIIDDDAMAQWAMRGPMRKAKGFFLQVGQPFICLCKSVYEQLGTGDAKAEYIVAHELGHSTEQPTRRLFMQMGAGALAGTAVGGGMYSFLSPEKQKTSDKAEKSSGIFPSIEKIAQLSVAFLGFNYGAVVVKSYLSRIEEFRADDIARDLIGNDAKFLLALSDFMLEVSTKTMGDDFIKCNREIADEIIRKQPLTDSLRNMGIDEDGYRRMVEADLIVKTQAVPLNAGQILSGKAYPGVGQRLLEANKKGVSLEALAGGDNQLSHAEKLVRKIILDVMDDIKKGKDR